MVSKIISYSSSCLKYEFKLKFESNLKMRIWIKFELKFANLGSKSNFGLKSSKNSYKNEEYEDEKYTGNDIFIIFSYKHFFL